MNYPYCGWEYKDTGCNCLNPACPSKHVPAVSGTGSYMIPKMPDHGCGYCYRWESVCHDLQRQLAEAEKSRETLLQKTNEQIYDLWNQIANRDAALAAAIAELEKSGRLREEAEAERDEAQADAAAMRDMLIKLESHALSCVNSANTDDEKRLDTTCFEARSFLLSDHPGQALLDRHAEEIRKRDEKIAELKRQLVWSR